MDNIHLNQLQDRTESHCFGIGATRRQARFTADRDTQNRVALDSDCEQHTIHTQLRTLDEVLNQREPALIKIDVEGFEHEILAGAEATFSCQMLRAVLIENGSGGARYGAKDGFVGEYLTRHGFIAHQYEPHTRELRQIAGRTDSGRNTLFVRDADAVQHQVKNSLPIELPRGRAA